MISETFAIRLGNRQLACRLIEHTPGHTFHHAGDLWRDREAIEATLDSEDMSPLEPPPEDWIGPLQHIGEERRSSWPAIEHFIENRILTGGHPRVLMFCDSTATAGHDVRAALGPHSRTYDLDEQLLPWTDAAAVAAALSVQKIDADLVAIVCGGGEELSALSDRRVIEAVAHQVPIPIVFVVDHIDDRPLIQDMVYQAFPTPTALGTWLAGRVTEA